jgi:hypothetical protein
MQREEFITIRAYINKTETTEINNLMMSFKLLKKNRKKSKPKTSRQKEVMKIRVKVNEIEITKLYKESIKSKGGSLKILTRLTNPYTT